MVNYPNYYQNYPAYQQQYPQPMQMTQPVMMQQPNQNQVLAWVKDEKEVVDYPLSAGQSIFLITQDEKYLYGKSCDQLGKISLMKKRLIDETENQDQKINPDEFIRREELEELITNHVQKIVERKMSEISFKPTKTKKPVIIDED